MIVRDLTMQQETQKKDFFISYNKADRAWAEWIAWQLEEAGYSTVVQAWDFRPGGNFVSDMQRAAEQAERTIAVLSPDYLNSKFTQPEWAAAFAQDPTGESGTLLPVRVRECATKGLLPQIVRVDLVGLQEIAARNALLAGARRGRAKPEAEPEFPAAARRAITKKPRFPGALPPVWNVPHNRNPNFTGRADLLEALRAALTSGRPAALTQTIHGLGGVGKTQLATEYAYRNSHLYDIVWWIRSEEPSSLAADYAGLAAKLGLPEAEAAQQKIIVEAVRSWLGQNGDWLLVFDNARNRAEVGDYLPQGTTGHVIVTSRDPNWRGVAQPLQVPVMPPDEAVDFLLKRTSQADKDAAEALASTLGYLPLALEQVGAYIEEKGKSFSEYAQLFEKYHQKLLERGTPSTKYPATVATTWDISFEEVRKQSPAAEDLMNLCAFLAPDDIPLEIISEGVEHLPESLAAEVSDPIAFDEILAAIRCYSLAERSGETISIHRLVQTVVRDRLMEDATKIWAEAALQLANKAFPFDSDDVRTWPVCSKLLPHTLIVIEHAKALRLVTQVLGRLLNQVGLYLTERAELDEAKSMYEQAIIVYEKTYGADHPQVAVSLSSLGNVLRQRGDLSGARANIERALKIAEAVDGPEHPNVAIRLNNLGMVLKDQGDLEGALTYFERALKIDEAKYGTNHPKVAIRLNNIGMVLSDKGNLAGARSHLERALAIDEAEYGLEHPNTAIRLNNLGFVLQEQGDLAGARSHYERALQIFRKFLGEDHPDTRMARDNLASLGNSGT